MKWKVINFIETTKHKLWVAWYMLKVCRALVKRAIIHDLSKYGREERPYFERALPKLRGLEYGAPEYWDALESLGSALQHHYRNNTHHPEHWGSVENMPLLDIIEMLCDWKAAGKRHATGDFAQSLVINRDRYKYSVAQTIVLKEVAVEAGLCRKE